MENLNLKTVNLNETIYFELNKGTFEAFGDDRQALADFIRYHVHEYTVDGKTVQLVKMQLWDFMLKFGKFFHWGGPGVTKDNNIYLRSKE